MVGATVIFSISPRLTPGAMPAPAATKVAWRSGRVASWPWVPFFSGFSEVGTAPADVSPKARPSLTKAIMSGGAGVNLGIGHTEGGEAGGRNDFADTVDFHERGLNFFGEIVAVFVVEDVDEGSAAGGDERDGRGGVRVFWHDAGRAQGLAGGDITGGLGEAVVGDDDECGAAGEVALELVPDDADLLVGGGDGGVGGGRARAFGVLGMVDIGKVKEGKLRTFFADEFAKERGDDVVLADGVGFVGLADGGLGGLVFVGEAGGGIFCAHILVAAIGHGEVEGLCVAGGGPADRGGGEAGLLGGVVDGGDLDDLVLVELRVADELDFFVGGAVEIGIGDDAVAAGIVAGDEGGVVGPGDGRGGDLHRTGAGALFGELAEIGQVGERVVEVVAGEAVDADEDDDVGPDMFGAERSERGEEESGEEKILHEGTTSTKEGKRRAISLASPGLQWMGNCM